MCMENVKLLILICNYLRTTPIKNIFKCAFNNEYAVILMDFCECKRDKCDMPFIII